MYACVHSNIIHNNPKAETTQVSIGLDGLKKHVVYTQDGTLVLERKEILTHAPTWRALCQVRQASHRRPSTVSFYLREVPRIIRFIGSESRMAVAQGGGGRQCSVGAVSAFPAEGSQLWMVVTVAQPCECT